MEFFDNKIRVQYHVTILKFGNDPIHFLVTATDQGLHDIFLPLADALCALIKCHSIDDFKGDWKEETPDFEFRGNRKE